MALAEYGVYFYAFFLFFDAGQSFREIGLYGALLGWLVMVVVRHGAWPKSTALSVALAVYILSVLASSAFSIKPAYSFAASWDDTFPAIVMFLVVPACFDGKRLVRLSGVLAAAGIILLFMGLHGLATSEPPLYTSTNSLLFADKNKYGFFLGFTLPFFLLFVTAGRKAWTRGGWGVLSLWTLAAGVLSRSRGSLGNMLAGVLVWATCFTNRKNLKYVAIAVAGIAVLVMVSLPFWPPGAKGTLAETFEDMRTMNLRTAYFWKPALEAVAKRPVLGWGYGSEVYRDPRPFEGTTTPNWELTGGLHSEFIRVLFHQGIVGIAAYLLLLAAGFWTLLKIVRSSSGFKSALAVSLMAVLTGSFVVNAFLKGTPFRMLGLVLGMAVALAAIPSEEAEE